jgi:pyrroline-5-carboxylate reductase
MQKTYPAMIGSVDNLKAVDGADIVILAVKPQVLKKVVTACANRIPQRSLIISIAAGITTQDIHRWMGSERPLVRCMPNTPSLVGQGAAGLYATKEVSQAQRTMAETVMQAVAKQVLWVNDEILIDVVTGISGSGPAYFFLILEAMRKLEGGDKG